MSPVGSTLRRRAAGVAAAASVLLLAACAAGPDYVPPRPPAARHYDLSAEHALEAGPAARGQQVEFARPISRDWWTSFHSAKLDALMRRVIAGNLDLVAADATIAQANEAIAAAAGGLSPQVDLDALAGRERSLGAAGPATRNFYSAGPRVSFDLDVFGGTRRLIEQQVALAALEHHRYDAAYLTLTSGAARQAILSASARAQIQATELLVAQDERTLAVVRAAHASGSATRVDVALARTQLAEDETLLPPLAQQREATRHALAILASEPPADWQAPEAALSEFELPPVLPVSLPSELARNRPDILAAEAQLHAASAAVGVATANQYPHLQLSGSASQIGPGQGVATLWDAAAGLTAPIFHGGSLRAARRASLDNYQASSARYRQTVIRSLGQVADILQAIHHDTDESAAQARALDAAEESLRLNQAGYRAGGISVLQVLDAQRAYQRALLGQIRAKTAQLLDTVDLAVALGGNASGASDGGVKPASDGR